MKRTRSILKEGFLEQRADGFVGQVIYVLPPHVIEATSHHPLIRSLYATDIGYFPKAAGHDRQRPQGAKEHILIYCSQGKGIVTLGSRETELHAHEAILIPKGMAHAYHAHADDPWTIYWAHVTGEETEDYLTFLPESPMRFPVSEACEKEAVALFKQAYRLLSSNYALPTLICLSQLMRLLLSTLIFNNTKYAPHLRVPTGRDLHETISYLCDHSSEPLSLERLAAQAKMSGRTFARLFQRQTGISPMQYLTQQRIKHARHLLTSTTLTVSEIARRVGYEDPYYFSRVFSKETALSPRQYRERYKL